MSKSVISSIIFSKRDDGSKYFRFSVGNVSYFVRPTDIPQEAATWLKTNLGPKVEKNRKGEDCVPFRVTPDAIIAFEELGTVTEKGDEFNTRLSGEAKIISLETAPSFVDDIEL